MSLTDEKGAAAAARYFFELYPYMLATGDFTEWDRMTGETCEYCTAQRGDIASRLSSGGSFSGSEVVVRIDQTYPVDNGLYPLNVVVTQGASTSFDSNHTVINTYPEESVPFQVHLRYESAGWKVLGVAALANVGQ